MDDHLRFKLDEEVASIEDTSIRLFTAKALERVPDYFWEAPASSTGRFHPLDTLGKGGLVLHTKRVAYLAEEIGKAFKIEGVQVDVLRCAAILHDSFKNGVKDNGHTEEDHPLIVRYQLKELESETSHFDEIMRAIECHQGLWGPKPLRMPSKPLEWALHIADFVASRTAIYLYFSGYNPGKMPEELEFPELSEDLTPAITQYLDLREKRAGIEKQMETLKLKITEKMSKMDERKVVTSKGSARLVGETHFKLNQPRLKEILEKSGFWDKVSMVNEKRLQELISDGLISEEDLKDSVEKVSKDVLRIFPRED